MLIAQHVSYLTKGQRKNFALLFKNLMKSFQPTNLGQPPSRFLPPLPIAFSDLRTKYVEGPHSILANLPYPAIQTDVPGHCYVKISDVIEDFLAHGFLPLQPSSHQATEWVTSVTQSPQLVSSLREAMGRYGQEPFLFVGFKEWQDDYESQYARTDRGSVWCKNITIIAQLGIQKHLCTYPIAFSNKHGDHATVEKELEKDMARFLSSTNNLFYSSKLGRQIPVHACLYVSLADQLERRPVTCTTHGNHNYHARFGYSIRFKSLLSRLPSCIDCRADIKQKLDFIYTGSYISEPRATYRTPICGDCLSWLHDLEAYPDLSYSPPESFPTSETDPSGNIHPFQLTFPKLIAAGLKAFEHIKEGTWTVQQAEAFLDVYCIISSVKQDIIQRASLQRQRNQNSGSTPEEQAILRQKIQEMLLLDPTILDDWEPPAIWKRAASLLQHLDAPMHLIFHGIIKGICRLLMAWLTERRTKESFNRYYKGLLDPILAFSLDWCKLTPFEGSFAGWLAENYVGLSKISLWFWSGLLQVSQDPEYEPPSTPYQRWTGKDCKAWLKARNLDITSLNASEAKAKVHELMTAPNGPPPVPPPTGGSLDSVLDMLFSLDRLVRVLMANAFPVGGKDVITLHILDFLNAFDTFKPFRDDRKFPEWLTMYNFLCLLNLPAAIDLFGPLRFNYEGSTEGEGFIPMVKPLLSQGMRKNWQKNLAHRFFRIRAMKLVIRDAHVFIGGSENEANGQVPYKKKLFQKYKRWEQVENNFRKGVPISLVVLHDGFVGAVVEDRDSWLLVPVSILQHAGVNSGLHYFKVELFERDSVGNVSRNIINIGRQASFLTFVLLLPWLKERRYTSNEEHSWTMIGHEYERLSPDGNLQTVYSLPIHLQQAMEEPFGMLNPQEDEVADDTNNDDVSVAYV
jgi:hypothetical protein